MTRIDTVIDHGSREQGILFYIHNWKTQNL